MPVPGLSGPARLRLRAGPSTYSIVGVTHTTASHLAMDAVTDILAEPVMPWDALICTSQAVVETVKALLAAQGAYLQWRFGTRLGLTIPHFPMISLGVHCKDFEFSEEDRLRARRSLGIGPDEVVALFVGRLSFHAKAHPHAMCVGLEHAARVSRKKIALVQCGWFANEATEKAFKEAQGRFSPNVRAVWSDGRDPRGAQVVVAGSRRLHFPVRQHPGNLRPDADRGDGGGAALHRDRLGRVQGHGARRNRRLSHSDHDAGASDPGMDTPDPSRPGAPATTCSAR